MGTRWFLYISQGGELKVGNAGANGVITGETGWGQFQKGGNVGPIFAQGGEWFWGRGLCGKRGAPFFGLPKGFFLVVC